MKFPFYHHVLIATAIKG